MSEKDLLLETKALREKIATLRDALVNVQNTCAYSDVLTPEQRAKAVRSSYVFAVTALQGTM